MRTTSRLAPYIFLSLLLSSCGDAIQEVSQNRDVDYKPGTTPDNISTREDTPVNFPNPVLNDDSTDTMILTLKDFTIPEHGTLTREGDGSFTYLPAANYFGTDIFYYIATDGVHASDQTLVTIDITPESDAPVITSDPETAATQDQEYVYQIIVTDPDPEEHFTYSLNTGDRIPQGLQIDDNGRMNWTPGATDIGAYQISVKVVDSNQLAGIQNYTLTVFDTKGPPIVARNTTLDATEGAETPVTRSTLESAGIDLASANHSYQLRNPPGHGRLLIGTADGDVSAEIGSTFSQTDIDYKVVRYQNNGDNAESDAFYIDIMDDSSVAITIRVSIVITLVNDTPIVVNNDKLNVLEAGEAIVTTDTLQVSDEESGPYEIRLRVNSLPAHGLLRLINPDKKLITLAVGNLVTQGDIDNGDVSYKHDGSETTDDSFQLQATDLQGASTQPFDALISITPVNDVPVAGSDNLITPRNTAITYDVLANDSDAENNQLAIVSHTQGIKGIVTVNTDNTITYTPDKTPVVWIVSPTPWTTGRVE